MMAPVKPNDSETTEELDNGCVCLQHNNNNNNIHKMMDIILDKIHTHIREGSGHCTEQNQCSRDKKLKLHQY